MTHRKLLLFLAVTALLLGGKINAQNTVALPRSLPETEGVSSSGINSFLQAVAESKIEFHSFI
jgi:hypothetical protein